MIASVLVKAGGLAPKRSPRPAVYLTSDDADNIHATALHIDGGQVGL